MFACECFLCRHLSKTPIHMDDDDLVRTSMQLSTPAAVDPRTTVPAVAAPQALPITPSAKRGLPGAFNTFPPAAPLHSSAAADHAYHAANYAASTDDMGIDMGSKLAKPIPQPPPPAPTSSAMTRSPVSAGRTIAVPPPPVVTAGKEPHSVAVVAAPNAAMNSSNLSRRARPPSSIHTDGEWLPASGGSTPNPQDSPPLTYMTSPELDENGYPISGNGPPSNMAYALQRLKEKRKGLASRGSSGERLWLVCVFVCVCACLLNFSFSLSSSIFITILFLPSMPLHSSSPAALHFPHSHARAHVYSGIDSQAWAQAATSLVTVAVTPLACDPEPSLPIRGPPLMMGMFTHSWGPRRHSTS
jgi:hypothetical protein